MSFAVFTDTSANLPHQLVQQKGITLVPFSYFVKGEEYTCLNSEEFSGDEYYGMIKAGVQVITSQVTPQRYIDKFTPVLQQGPDILFVSMSSGISGSCASARMAVTQLAEQFPQRSIRIVDTLGASLGEGLIVLEAADWQDAGRTLDETEAHLNEMCRCMCQIFTVDDLMHLRRGGRLSNLSAIVGTVLSIKPLLRGSEEGTIVAFEKVRGRRRSIEALAEKFDTLAVNPEQQIVGIAQAGCKEDAAQLAELLRRNHPPKEILTVEYEPVTGAHVGPGALALFFLGDENVRKANG